VISSHHARTSREKQSPGHLSEPIWITSTGVVNTDNRTQFLTDMFAAAPTYGIQGIICFDYQQFLLGAAPLSTLKSVVQ
jgi:hypothetical protein